MNTAERKEKVIEIVNEASIKYWDEFPNNKGLELDEVEKDFIVKANNEMFEQIDKLYQNAQAEIEINEFKNAITGNKS